MRKFQKDLEPFGSPKRRKGPIAKLNLVHLLNLDDVESYAQASLPPTRYNDVPCQPLLAGSSCARTFMDCVASWHLKPDLQCDYPDGVDEQCVQQVALPKVWTPSSMALGFQSQSRYLGGLEVVSDAARGCSSTAECEHSTCVEVENSASRTSSTGVEAEIVADSTGSGMEGFSPDVLDE